MQHFLSLNVTKFSVQAVYDYVRSINSRVIVNGVDVVGGERVSAGTFEKLCGALYVHAYKRLWMGTKLISEIVADESGQRSKGERGLFVAFFKGIINGRDNITDESPSMLGSVKAIQKRALSWFNYSGKINVSFEQAVQFLEYADAIPQLYSDLIGEPMLVSTIESAPSMDDDPHGLRGDCEEKLIEFMSSLDPDRDSDDDDD